MNKDELKEVILRWGEILDSVCDDDKAGVESIIVDLCKVWVTL
jgi:hypothetical protein